MTYSFLPLKLPLARVLLGALAATAAVPMFGSAPRRRNGGDQERGLIVATEETSSSVHQGRQADRLRNELVEDLRKYAPFEIKQEILPGPASWRRQHRQVRRSRSRRRSSPRNAELARLHQPDRDATQLLREEEVRYGIKSIKDRAARLRRAGGSALLGLWPELRG